MRLPLRTSETSAVPATTSGSGRPVPRRFWLFAAFAVLYGICETMNGNWSEPFMKHLGATTTTASVALAAFWVMVTVGRVLFAQIESFLPTPRTFHLLPVVLVATFVVLSVIPHGSTTLGVLTFAVAGLGCSALLPLAISFSQEQLTTISASVASGVIAFYQLGYGIAAFGAGPLQNAGVTLSTIFGFTAAVALALGLLSLVLARATHRIHRVHPRPPSHLHAA